MQRPSIHPYAYRTRILLLPLLLLLLCFTIVVVVVVALLLLLQTVATDKLFLGAAELTTQLLRLASILWLPLCRINKFANTTREDCCDPLYFWVTNTSFF